MSEQCLEQIGFVMGAFASAIESTANSMRRCTCANCGASSPFAMSWKPSKCWECSGQLEWDDERTPA